MNGHLGMYVLLLENNVYPFQALLETRLRMFLGHTEIRQNLDPQCFWLRASCGPVRSHPQRALTRFRSSTYQPADEEEGQNLSHVQPALADTLPLSEAPNNCTGCGGTNALTFYTYFSLTVEHGNPGPGGSGSVIVKVHLPTHTVCVTWVACVAYGHASTTNNIAEYRGLVHGLHQAKASENSPQHEIGDSSLVLS
ncbi:unnamed protein product [Peronospora belbahrii]|uniref:RNase H type-1 domain-containing protein n=1 Tax=Peronospora belbahrii TaxID=622444 RepID=A0ABN8D0G4_9STRA|nr:unnamed protein product [Peronospora belbahrii]